MAGFRTFATGEVLTAANVNDFLMKQSVMVFDDATARTAALGAEVVEGMLTYNKDTDQLEVFDGTNFVAAAPEPPPTAGFLFAGTRYIEESGAFLKADPFGTGDIGVQAIRVRMVGGGGGGGRRSGGRAAGGGGANYAESFITDLEQVSASATVTVAAGGAGGNVSPMDGADGGTSSFDAGNPKQVVATGGGGGTSAVQGIGSKGLAGSIGQFVSIGGGSGGSGGDNNRPSAAGGSSLLGGGAPEGRSDNNNVTGQPGTEYGGGGGGAKDNRNGGSGAAGFVIIDVFV